MHSFHGQSFHALVAGTKSKRMQPSKRRNMKNGEVNQSWEYLVSSKNKYLHNMSACPFGQNDLFFSRLYFFCCSAAEAAADLFTFIFQIFFLHIFSAYHLVYTHTHSEQCKTVLCPSNDRIICVQMDTTTVAHEFDFFFRRFSRLPWSVRCVQNTQRWCDAFPFGQFCCC